MPNFEVREVTINLDETEDGGAVPLPAGWEPVQAVREARFLIVLCKREATVGP